MFAHCCRSCVCLKECIFINSSACVVLKPKMDKQQCYKCLINLQHCLTGCQSPKHRPAHILTHTHRTRQTLTTCCAEPYRLSGVLQYDITTPNETKISLITSSAHFYAIQMQGLFCTTFSSHMVLPSSPFCCHYCLCTEHRLRA